MGCGESLVKYILFFMNLFSALAGLALLGLGVAVKLKVANVIDFLEENQLLRMAPISVMVVGGVVFIIAFFGCCGAVTESYCMLVTYSIFVLVLMILKITMAVLIFVNLDNFLAQIPRWLQEALAMNKNAFHEIERLFQCCGPTDRKSYGILKFPQTCCDPTASVCTIFNKYPECSTVITNFFSTFGTVIGWVTIVVVAVELVAVVFGLCLANHARNKRYRRSGY